MYVFIHISYITYIVTQVELDRFQDTLSVLRDYYLGMCRPRTPPFPPTHFTCLPLVDAAVSRDTAPLQGDRQAPPQRQCAHGALGTCRDPFSMGLTRG